MCGNWFSGWPFGGMMSGFGWGGMILPFLLGLGILILLIILVATLVRKDNSSEGTDPANRALQVLKERYAHGEITQEQYQMMVKDIR